MKDLLFKELDACEICPRTCVVNRNAGETGYCGCGAGFEIASICIHKGEEPPISGKNGIVNVFFRGCNLSCTYCQNYQISRKSRFENPLDADIVLEKIVGFLHAGAQAVGFVSPSHFTPHVRFIIQALHERGHYPIMVYNTNAFDSVHELRKLEGLIDVFLPDFKYFDPSIAQRYSNSGAYPEVAKAALLEMFRQKGSNLILDNEGHAVTGMIIRHLVLPGYSGDSVRILKWIADELSVSVRISLMSQYFPTSGIINDPQMGRPVTASEYKSVSDSMEVMGFYNGWIQDMNSPASYQPDFEKEQPFEEQ